MQPKTDPSRFDRFAEAASEYVSRGVFFAACVVLLVVWAPSYFALGNFDTWQLLINTATTIVTFLLVALLQNTGRRSDHAIHHKLDALADGLADLMEHQLHADAADLRHDIAELKDAVGLERHHSRAGGTAAGRLLVERRSTSCGSLRSADRLTPTTQGYVSGSVRGPAAVSVRYRRIRNDQHPSDFPDSGDSDDRPQLP